MSRGGCEFCFTPRVLIAEGAAKRPAEGPPRQARDSRASTEGACRSHA